MRRAALPALAAWPWLLLSLAGCAPEQVRIQDPELVAGDSPFRYPIELWDDGIEGETVLMVRVTGAGAVDSAYVYESSGQAAFDSAAVRGARELRFVPGRRDEREVDMWARVPVRFSLNGTEPVEESP